MVSAGMQRLVLIHGRPEVEKHNEKLEMCVVWPRLYRAFLAKQWWCINPDRTFIIPPTKQLICTASAWL
eukprot:14221880-Heterocapsa_arctica.AAC.1